MRPEASGKRRAKARGYAWGYVGGMEVGDNGRCVRTSIWPLKASSRPQQASNWPQRLPAGHERPPAGLNSDIVGLHSDIAIRVKNTYIFRYHLRQLVVAVKYGMA